MKHTVTATFKTRQAAEQALIRLEAEGFTEDKIGLVVTDDTRGKSFNIDKHTKADEGAAAGATAGGIVGAVIAGLLSAGALAIPGLNIVVSGTLISALAGLGAGAATGGLLGGLVGLGIPEHEAKLYESAVKTGAILLAVEVENGDQKKRVREILDETDAYNIAA